MLTWQRISSMKDKKADLGVGRRVRSDGAWDGECLQVLWDACLPVESLCVE